MAIHDFVRRAGNEALDINHTVATIDITTAASDFLWMVFSVMAATTIGVGIWAQFGVKHGQRTFHHLSMMITGTASVAYFCMASDLGSVAIPVEFVRGTYNANPVTRSIWYARYIDWTITTPLLLLELLMVTGLPLSDIVITIFADLIMIITGLIGSLVQSSYKWGLYTFGCVAMLYVFYMLYFPGRQASLSLGNELSKTYLIGASILSFLWFLYPIAWGLADGGNVISPTGEMVFYGVLDLFAKPVFALVHLYSMRKIDYSRLELNSGKYSDFSKLQGDVPSSSGAGNTTTQELKGNQTNPAHPISNGKPADAPHGAVSPTAGAESTVHGH
jgi:bacteriorhodopsin